MENAESILVIILSVFLAIFLVSSIVLIVKCIQVAKQLKRITDKAEQLVDHAESVGEFFQRASGRFALGRLVTNLAEAVFNKGQKTSRRRK